jgi:hypothetical protein
MPINTPGQAKRFMVVGTKVTGSGGGPAVCRERRRLPVTR